MAWVMIASTFNRHVYNSALTTAWDTQLAACPDSIKQVSARGPPQIRPYSGTNRIITTQCFCSSVQTASGPLCAPRRQCPEASGLIFKSWTVTARGCAKYNFFVCFHITQASDESTLFHLFVQQLSSKTRDCTLYWDCKEQQKHSSFHGGY